MEKNMETDIVGCIGIIGYILGLYREKGKENGNSFNGLYHRDYYQDPFLHS